MTGTTSSLGTRALGHSGDGDSGTDSAEHAEANAERAIIYKQDSFQR